MHEYIVIVVGSFLPIKWNKRKHPKERLLKLEINNKTTTQKKSVRNEQHLRDAHTRHFMHRKNIFQLSRALTVVKGNVYQQFISIFSSPSSYF